jgi:ATP-binding cassette subfamily F protein 3
VFKREDRKASGQARQRLAEQTKPLRREMEQIDATLNKLADERTAVEGELASGSAAAARIAELGKRLKAIHDELESAELRWLELSAQVDAIQAGA